MFSFFMLFCTEKVSESSAIQLHDALRYRISKDHDRAPHHIAKVDVLQFVSASAIGGDNCIPRYITPNDR